MATTESDYYELLGVPRGASDADIKRAFRTLARELHPDVSGEPDAAARFRDIAEAYEVLSDPERRATYDRFGKAGLRRGGFETAFTDFGSVSDIFAAFFGEDLVGGRCGRRAGDVVAELPDMRGSRGRAERRAEHVRPVRPAAVVSRVRGRRRGARAAVFRLSR